MAFNKQTTFTKKPNDLPDIPSDTLTPTDIKSYFQTPHDELMATVNNAIDTLNSTEDGNSGADNIGATGFDGTPSDPQTMLDDLNTRKADKGTDWTGTWQGFTPSKADPGISSVVEQHTSQLVDIAINIRDKGAIGSPIVDDTAIIQNIYNSLQTGDTLIIPRGEFYITNLVFDKDEIFIDCRGTLVQLDTASGIALTIGKTTPSFSVEGNLKLRKQTRDWTQDNTGVKILNMNEGIFKVDIRNFTNNLELEGNNNGCAYNAITIKKLANGKKNFQCIQTGTGWVNENKFFVGRFQWDTGIADKDRYHIYIPDNAMNNNVFFSPSLESADGGTLLYCNGQYNNFIAPRLEGDATTIKINFDNLSYSNHLFYPYSATDIFNDSNYIDHGTRNQIFGRDTIQLDRTQIRPHNIKIRGSLSGNSNWGNTALVDVESTSSNADKLWSGKNTGNTETSYIDGNGSTKVLDLTIGDGTKKILSTGEFDGAFKASASYVTKGMVPWAVAASAPSSSAPALTTPVFCTADNKLYVHIGSGVWKSSQFS